MAGGMGLEKKKEPVALKSKSQAIFSSELSSNTRLTRAKCSPQFLQNGGPGRIVNYALSLRAMVNVNKRIEICCNPDMRLRINVMGMGRASG